MVGYDIGFEAATEDWFHNYACAWITHHNKDKGKCKK
jgi:hypothetical protein